MASASLPNIFTKRTARVTDIAVASSAQSLNSKRQLGINVDTTGRIRSSITTSTSSSSISHRPSLKEKVATASDSVLKGLRLTGLRSEEIVDDGGKHYDKGKIGAKYVEVGVNELYRHKLSECIFAARRRSEVHVATLECKKANAESHTSRRHEQQKRTSDDSLSSALAFNN